MRGGQCAPPRHNCLFLSAPQWGDEALESFLCVLERSGNDQSRNEDVRYRRICSVLMHRFSSSLCAYCALCRRRRLADLLLRGKGRRSMLEEIQIYLCTVYFDTTCKHSRMSCFVQLHSHHSHQHRPSIPFSRDYYGAPNC